MRKAKEYAFASLAALGLIQLGRPLAYITFGDYCVCYPLWFYINWIQDSSFIPPWEWPHTSVFIIDELFDAASEEIFYRLPLFLTIYIWGQRSMTPPRPLYAITLLFSIIAFAATHIAPLHPLFISITLTLLLIKTKSLLPPILTHFAWNVSRNIDLLTF